MEQSAHDLTRTRLCRERGCEELAVTPERGRYANLCQQHFEEAKKRANGTPPTAAAARPAVTDTTASYVNRVRALVPHAKKVDKAIAHADKQRKAVEPQLRKANAAKTAAADAVDEFKTAVRQLAL